LLAEVTAKLALTRESPRNLRRFGRKLLEIGIIKMVLHCCRLRQCSLQACAALEAGTAFQLIVVFDAFLKLFFSLDDSLQSPRAPRNTAKNYYKPVLSARGAPHGATPPCTPQSRSAATRSAAAAV
jgi:hypothetical protein